MSDYVIEADLREATGRSATRRLRRAGQLPGIVYGGDKPDLAITMDYNTMSKMLNEEQFYTTLIDVKVKGSRGKNTVLLKDAQYDPIKDIPTHLDFMRVSAKDTITVDVPVQATNTDICPGVKVGGLVDLIRHSLEVTCRADSIPEHIVIDCAELEIGDTVHIDDVTLPEGAAVQHEVNFTVLNISAPKAASGDEEVEAEAEDAAEDGAETE